MLVQVIAVPYSTHRSLSRVGDSFDYREREILEILVRTSRKAKEVSAGETNRRIAAVKSAM